jgi:hypothetical protein
MQYQEFMAQIAEAGKLAAVGATLMASLHDSIGERLPTWSILPSFTPHRLDVDFWGLRLVFRVAIQLEKEPGRTPRGMIIAHTLSYGNEARETALGVMYNFDADGNVRSLTSESASDRHAFASAFLEDVFSRLTQQQVVLRPESAARPVSPPTAPAA